MIASSFNWGKKRVGNVYTVDTSQAIVLENTSNGDVTIHGIAFKTNNRGEAFEFNKKAFDNITIPTDGFYRVPVKFYPDSVGEYELVIVYDNSVNSQTETHLYGIGVKPVISVKNVDFDTSVVNKFTKPNFNTIHFSNFDWRLRRYTYYIRCQSSTRWE